MLWGYDLDIWQREHVLYPLRTSLSDYTNVLFNGSSGSGKSMAVLFALSQLEPCEIFFLDFKGDYPELMSTNNYYSGDDVISALVDYHAEFQAIRRGDLKQEKRRLLVIEEYASLVNYLPKKDSEQVKSIVQTLLMLGRGTGLGHNTWIVCQRSDSSILPGGGKLNMHVIMLLGNASPVDWSVCLSGIEQPKRTFQRSQGCIWIDGRGLRNIIVPTIRSKEKMILQVEKHLNGNW
ncbi:MAG: ATP-binding protein [Lachnospiraceae bacterium]|nr:ATP-binding protein [Lachnospiraceae bacterium]